MNIPDTERKALELVMHQAENDLAAAHAEICKLQGLDPATHTWPEWSAPANTLRWFQEIRVKFGIGGRQIPPHRSGGGHWVGPERVS